MRRTIAIGLLYSLTGSYARIGTACLTGALAAIDRINADPARGVTFRAVTRDPGGNIDLYAPLCAEILRDTPARHIIGCVTSWSRKDVIPTLEKYGGSLWYAVPYEGFEASDHVVYLHACPNQHLLPLLDWALPTCGKRAYLTGSNYIWGWEINRLARERITAAGGSVAGERYLPLGSVDIDRMIEEVRATAPDFILNSLIGPSSYAFLRAYEALGAQDSRFAADCCPVLSCNLTECELPEIGEAAEGLIAAGPYFRVAGTTFGSSHEAAAWRAVHALADLMEAAPAAQSLGDLLRGPAGQASGIDLQTHHTVQPVLIAQVRDGAFAVLGDYGSRMGDPYLTGPAAPAVRASLRVVS
ncbi:transporter substrate-binding protein [Loktanella sp. DJP18]|uniref:transporter substrate-binding protein n=1 Tax=Loktanella sp. DJP18 TaxID=3409788 RepID=UPI003BB68921